MDVRMWIMLSAVASLCCMPSFLEGALGQFVVPGDFHTMDVTLVTNNEIAQFSASIPTVSYHSAYDLTAAIIQESTRAAEVSPYLEPTKFMIDQNLVEKCKIYTLDSKEFVDNAVPSVSSDAYNPHTSNAEGVEDLIFRFKPAVQRNDRVQPFFPVSPRMDENPFVGVRDMESRHTVGASENTFTSPHFHRNHVLIHCPAVRIVEPVRTVDDAFFNDQPSLGESTDFTVFQPNSMGRAEIHHIISPANHEEDATVGDVFDSAVQMGIISPTFSSVCIKKALVATVVNVGAAEALPRYGNKDVVVLKAMKVFAEVHASTAVKSLPVSFDAQLGLFCVEPVARVARDFMI